MYERIKRNIQVKSNEIVGNFLKYLKDFKLQDEFEEKLEEYVLYHLDVNVITILI